MKSNSKSLTLVFTILCLIFTQNTFAARLSGGKSYGTNRSYSGNSYSKQNTNTTQQQTTGAQPSQGTPSRGMGAGTGALLGAAAGGAAGYMLGKNAANHNASDVSQSPSYSQQSNIPWGIIAILGALLIIGLMFFRRSRPVTQTNNQFRTSDSQQQNSFQIPTINKNSSSSQTYNQTQTQPIQAAPTIEKMPDGVETMYFLRQVKGTFLHVQSMNNKENISEIAKYMTNDLYAELKDVISNNQYVADFTKLDCELVDAVMENNQLIASVKFSGLVSDEPNKAPEAFSEIWHFVKSDLNSNKWLISGIQQVQ